jgi:hypothetical protein
MAASTLCPESIRWKGRDATRLTNGIVELIALSGGGHLAELRFVESEGRSSQNVFWEPPWATYDPVPNPPEALLGMYGTRGVGKFMAGYAGHALCLDYFGEPSAEEVTAGLSLHGEAPVLPWNVTMSTQAQRHHCRWKVRLPVAQLTFERQVRLRDGENVLYVQETVSNERDLEHAFDWVQHVTFGPPFLNESQSTLLASAARGITWPLGYEGGSLLAGDREFVWPFAPCEDVERTADLRQPFSTKGRGFVAGIQLDPGREIEHVLAVNWKLRLGVGYCFRRQDFPWMTVWEENFARQGTPWNGSTQARGMEFGTTPLPLGREATFRRGRIFDTPSWCVIPAGGRRRARYLIFLFVIPSGIHSIQNVALKGDDLVLFNERTEPAISIPAHGCERFLSRDSFEPPVDLMAGSE